MPLNKIYGNDLVKDLISSQIEQRRLAHTFIIEGPEKSGKTLLAKLIAASMTKNQSDIDTIMSDASPDVIIVDLPDKAKTIGVGAVREIREKAYLIPNDLDYKVFIIEKADSLTVQAQNALLKVLEEPPSNVLILILATEADKILTTIKSRAQLIQTEIFNFDELLENVCELSDTAEAMKRADPKRLRGILLSSAGVIGVALESLDEKRSEEIAKDRALVLSFVEALPKKAPFSQLYTALTAFPTKRDELRATLEALRTAIRDMTVIRVSEDTEPIFFLSREDAEAAAGSIGAKRLVAVFDIVSEAISDIDKNVVIAPLLSDMAIKIKEA